MKIRTYNFKLNSKMKRIILFFMVMGFAGVLKAQNDAIDRFFSKYIDDPEFTYAVVTGKMFGLFTHMEGESENDKALLDAISSVKGLKVLAIEDTERGTALYTEAFTIIPAREYEELMTVRDEDGNMKFLIKEAKGIISELLMIRGATHDFMIVSLVGNIDLKSISKLARHVNIDGFEHFEKMEKKEEKH
jgi:hypothetical protein